MACKGCAAQTDLLYQMLVDETAEPKALPLSLLEDITRNFSYNHEIGNGGFAVVYKGILGNRAVAVKRLSKAYMHETEFQREVQCLMRVKHKNIVRFLGYCSDTQGNMERYNGELVMADVPQRLLCFEYIPKGSLDKYIANAYREWGTCYKIIKGICEGLKYLHENHIVHLDLKPANILLSDNMVPKITDFGLSRRFDQNQSRDITKTVLGTLGYLAPELCEGGVITRSADLYSLGVIIIEILTGHKGYQATEDVLQSWSDRLGRSHRDILCEQIRVCYETALECRDINPKKRPASVKHILDRLHEMESTQVKKLRESSIGILKVDIMGAHLSGIKSPYCVAKYGEKWVRTRALLDTAAPQWNERYTWDVFDVNTVITIAVFNDHHLSSHGGHAGRDQRMGKVRVRLATLETDCKYTMQYPLMALTSSGLKEMGELHLAVRFTCTAWAKMLAMYGKPLLPNMHHISTISTLQRDDDFWLVQQEHLRFHAVRMMARQLERAEPPLRREVVEYMLDLNSHLFSLRRSKANFYRITSLFSGAVAVAKWFDGICKWKNPLTTILVHVVFLALVSYPKLILLMAFLCIIMNGAWNYWARPLTPPQIDTILSYADQALPDDLVEELDTLPTSLPQDIVLMRYYRLRSLAWKAQTVVGDLATHAERAQSVLNWSDPRVTPIFITLSLVMAIVLYLTPFRVVAMLMGLYLLRHPWFRSSKINQLFFNLHSRLPSKEDLMLV